MTQIAIHFDSAVVGVDRFCELSGMTKATVRRRIEKGRIPVLPKQGNAQRGLAVRTPHASYAMAAFTHINPEGARFTTGDFGGYYCAPSLDTAIKETLYHQERLYTNEPAQRIQMRSLSARSNLLSGIS